MSEGRQKRQWDYTAAIIAAIYEQNRDEKQHPTPFNLFDFHPLREALPPAVMMLTGAELHEIGKQFPQRKKK